MTDRILDIATGPAKLSVSLGRLVLSISGQEHVIMPEELAAIVISSPDVNISHRTIALLMEHGVVFITCDERHMPCGMMLPIAGNGIQTERFAMQGSMDLPSKKRAWQSIVKAKIKNQSHALKLSANQDYGLSALVRKVASGDPDNIEGQAARKYWPLIFNNPDFTRDRDLGGINSYLNYGYAILRAMTARSICASGLHPSLGIHHHNRYDSYCLASDLMEPYRPIVDISAARYYAKTEHPAELDKESKKRVLTDLTKPLESDGKNRKLSSILDKMCSSLVSVAMQERKNIVVPGVNLEKET